MSRWIKRLVLALAALVVLLLVGMWWLLGTESGARQIFRLAESQTDGAITVSGVSGRFSDRLKLEHLKYEDPGLALDLRDVELSMAPSELLERSVKIHELLVREIIVTVKETNDPAAANAGPPEPLELPVTISIDKIAVERAFERSQPEQPVEDLNLSLSWQGTDLTLDGVSASVAGAIITGSAEIVTDANPRLSAALEWLLPSETTADLQGELGLSGDLRELNFDHRLLEPMIIISSGRLLLSDAPSLEVTSTADSVEYDVDGGVITGKDVSLELSGWINEFEATGSAIVGGGVLPDGHVAIQANGDLATIEFSKLDYQTLTGGLSASGKLRLDEEISFESFTHLNEVQIPALEQYWPGSINGQLEISGGLESDTLYLRAEAIDLTSTSDNTRAQLKGAAWWDGQQVTLTEMHLSQGSDRVMLHGSLTPAETLELWHADLDFDVLVQDFSAYIDGWSGRVDGAGEIKGSLKQAIADFELNANDVKTGFVSISQMHVLSELADTSKSSSVSLEATGLIINENPIDELKLALTGTTEAHKLAVIARSAGIRINTQLRGRFINDSWDGVIHDSQIESGNHPTLTQQRESQLSVDGTGGEITDFCLRSSASSACITGVLNQQMVQGDIVADALELSPLNQFLPEKLRLDGQVDGKMSLSGTIDAPHLDYEFVATLSQLSMRAATNPRDIAPLFNKVHAFGKMDNNQVQFEAVADGSGADQVNINGIVTDWQTSEPAIDASVKATMKTLDALVSHLPDLDIQGEHLTADLTLQGNITLPAVNGNVLLQAESISYPSYAVHWNQPLISVKPSGASGLLISGSVTAEDQPLSLMAELDFADSQWPVLGSITAVDFPLLTQPDLSLTISPDLTFATDLRPEGDSVVRVAGKVHVPSGRLLLPEIPETAVATSPDVVIVGEAADDSSPEAEARLLSDIELTLGDDVRFEGLGLSTRLTGNLRLTDSLNKASTANGLIRLEDGLFSAYGQELTVTRGQLLFTDTLSDPDLFVEATRKIGEITAGIRVTGRADATSSTLFSDPSLPEADILSYLLIGRPVRSASGAEGDALRNAALSLGLNRALPVVDQIGRSLGLDEVGIGTSGNNSSALIAGKQLSENLYLRYSYGLFDGIGALLLRYDLSNRLSLEAQSGESQSLDLLYSNSKGK